MESKSKADSESMPMEDVVNQFGDKGMKRLPYISFLLVFVLSVSPKITLI